MAAFVCVGAGAGVATRHAATGAFVCGQERRVATGSESGRVMSGAALPMTMMRHGNRLKKLGLPADQRKALLRSLTTELIRHGRITTTLARCKEVRKTADHMVTLAKDNSLHARRQALAYLYDKDLVHALFEGVPERYADRNGGYTRVLRTMPRKGDNAPMGIIELV
mmetsp:Transcript_5830/g.15528  ORF Transcript_5830/g.15528 Transcript_5830/m.15528 type:complete len:167 (+) Transcript_5830:72-572(+)